MSAPSLPASCARRFRPVRLLAQGGYGSVVLAQQISLDRPVAVKVLHGEVLAADVAVKRFLNEARLTSQLAHPNIVVLVDHDIENGVPWIAYEYVEGRSLRDRLENGNLPWRDAVQIAVQIASALEAAHARGVLHRDIKPDNVLEASPGHYKVADFGIAREAGSKTLTASGELVGTPAYLSPVQLKGDVPGPESDLYALGVTLFELVTGRLPFESDTVVGMLQQQLMAEPPRPSSKLEGLPAGLDRVILRALAKGRAERYASATELRADLEQLLAERPRPSQRTQAVPGARPTGRTRPVDRPRDQPVAAPGRRFLGPVAAAVLSAALAFAAFRSRPPAPVVSPTPVASVPAVPETRVALIDFYARPVDDRMLVILERAEPVALTVSARPLRGPGAAATATLPADQRRERLTLTGLAPETAYAVDVTTPGGAKVVDRYEVQTLQASVGREMRSLRTLPLMGNKAFAQHQAREALDDRAVGLVAAALADPGLNIIQLGDLAEALVQLRHPGLSERLVKRLGEAPGPVARAILLNALIACRAPAAERHVLDVLAEERTRANTEDDHVAQAVDIFARTLSLLRSAAIARAVVASLEENRTEVGNRVGQCLAYLDTSVALESAVRWLSDPRYEKRPDLYRVAISACARVPPAAARAALAPLIASADERVLRRAARVVAAVGPEMRDAVGQALVRRADVPELVHAAASLGLESAVPLLFDEIRTEKGHPVHATLALAGTPGDARHPALGVALRSANPAVASAAVWAIGHARLAALAPALASPGPDPLGLALWARARLGDPTAAPLVLARLKALETQAPGTRRSQAARLLAAAAVELSLAAAIPSLSALAPGVRANDRCLHAALDRLRGTGRAQFLVVPGDLLALRTGLRHAAGESWTLSSWDLEPHPDVRPRHEETPLFTHSEDAPTELSNRPLSTRPTSPRELVLTRTIGMRVLPDEKTPRDPAQIVVVE